MIKKEDLLIKDFYYNLPEDSVAKHPLPQRDESKLLIYKDGNIEQSIYKKLPKFLPHNCLLIFNNTKVTYARLLFAKPTGSTIELFCLEPADEYKDVTTAMMQRGSVQWKCLVGRAKKWKEELLVNRKENGKRQIVLSAKKLAKIEGLFLIQFSWNDDEVSFAEILHLFGNIPLPPYLNREAEDEDTERYQTIYAKQEGSVAAPTAGLHFTDDLFTDLKKKSIDPYFITLHVGAGTFKPVKTETVAEHKMHAEWIDVSVGFIECLLKKLPEKIIAVGTTSLRTIESLYWLGVKTIIKENATPGSLFLLQWEVYDLPKGISAFDALQALLRWMKKNKLQKIITQTQIIIIPGYELQMADGLITNFHQPQSTLLLLIAAIVGDDWKKIYDYALHNDFRFLSYGDGSLLWKKDKT